MRHIFAKLFNFLDTCHLHGIIKVNVFAHEHLVVKQGCLAIIGELFPPVGVSGGVDCGGVDNGGVMIDMRRRCC